MSAITSFTSNSVLKNCLSGLKAVPVSLLNYEDTLWSKTNAKAAVFLPEFLAKGTGPLVLAASIASSFWLAHKLQDLKNDPTSATDKFLNGVCKVTSVASFCLGVLLSYGLGKPAFGKYAYLLAGAAGAFAGYHFLIKEGNYSVQPPVPSFSFSDKIEAMKLMPRQMFLVDGKQLMLPPIVFRAFSTINTIIIEDEKNEVYELAGKSAVEICQIFSNSMEPYLTEYCLYTIAQIYAFSDDFIKETRLQVDGIYHQKVWIKRTSHSLTIRHQCCLRVTDDGVKYHPFQRKYTLDSLEIYRYSLLHCPITNSRFEDICMVPSDRLEDAVVNYNNMS